MITAQAFLFILGSGAAVVALSFALDRLWAAAVPFRSVYLIVRMPGVVLHECAHIAGCVLTGARIRRVVFFSPEGGSVTYTRPVIPYLGDVVISTAPLFLLPLVISLMTAVFSAYLGCTFPDLPALSASPGYLPDMAGVISALFKGNIFPQFNGWFLLYLYLTISIVLSVAPSLQDMKNAAAGALLLALGGLLLFQSGIPLVVSVLTGLVHLTGSGLMLGLVFGLIALAASVPLLIWHVARRRS